MLSEITVRVPPTSKFSANSTPNLSEFINNIWLWSGFVWNVLIQLRL